MLEFEKHVTEFFTRQRINFAFDEKKHLLISSRLNIRFIPVCTHHSFAPEGDFKITNPFTIRLWEDIFFQNRAVVESRLRSALGISKRLHGRETMVKEISQAMLDEFIVHNHLNVPVRARYRYGLFVGAEPVAVAAFGRSCPIQHQGVTYRSHELIRYGSLLNHTVVGGLSKLIHHFEQTQQPQHLMTSVDREWSEGKSYLQLGFGVAGITKPQTFWLSPDDCKRYYPNKLPAGLDLPTIKNQGWRQINNLGNLKLVKFV